MLGKTGPNNTVQVFSAGELLSIGVTGLGHSGSCRINQASGQMVKWNDPIIDDTPRGFIGFTTIGTAAQNIVINNSNYYNVRYNFTFTGLPSGASVICQQFLNATRCRICATRNNN